MFVVLDMYGVIKLISVSLYGIDIAIFVCVVAVTAADVDVSNGEDEL